VHELRQQFPLLGLLKLAALPRSTYYHRHNASLRVDKDAQLKADIQAIYARHQGRYGYRRITAALRQLGKLVNHKLVQRLMGELDLKSLVRPKRYRSYKGEVGKTAPNILKRRFDSERPNQKWVTDVTEFKVAGEKLYLSPVLDLYNGEVVAYQTARKPEFAMVSAMLKKAIKKLHKDDTLLLHSDQGWQYQMAAYQRQLQQRRIEQSMSRKGNCLDNAAMESFFGTLKSELFHLQKFASIDNLETAIHDYIHYYNNDRIKLKLKGLSPVQYRTQPSLG
jgi:transposase InsO family protein